MIRKYLEKWRVPGFRNPKPVVAVVRLSGVISDRSGLGRSGLSAAGLVTVLETAFKMPNLKAVALAINSPGGSPVQSSLIGKRIRALAEEHEVPVIAFAEDVAASGGYWLACAADEIYADDSSVIGSIGVISAGFGFQNAIKKLGVERRVHTAGEMKSTLDPFLRENPDDVERLIELQQDVFDAFKEMVRERRKDKLTASEDEVFTGAFWTGRRALEMGLIDGLGDLTSVMQERYGDKVRFRPVEQRQNWFKQKLGLGSAVRNWPSSKGTVSSIVDDVLVAIEERGLWHKFGL
ncbi:MAG: S49 family peptidase [Rhodospirillaceae bacterium]|jgi:signal peptide peptidase SppA|nr:S49 family peptidase [Rhodospirillaceae bacterium]